MSDTDATTEPATASPYPTLPTDRVQAWMDRHAFTDWYYILPMATFLALLFVISYGGGWDLAGRLAQLLLVGGLVAWTWRRLTKMERNWSHLGLGAVFGVIGLVQWIGMDKLLRAVPWLGWTYYGGGPPVTVGGELPEDYTNLPTEWGSLSILVIAIRMTISVIVVPPMEEIFWRDFLWRSLASPNDLHKVGVGEFDKVAFFGTAGAFALVHPQWLVAIGYGLLMSLLIWRTKSLGSVIVAHAVTNCLLWVYVLVMWYGFGIDEWYFW